MEDLTRLVEHMQAQGIGGNGHQGPAGLGAAEDSSIYGLHVTAQRTGSIDHVVDIAAVLADMLESMQVAAHVHVHVVMPEQDGVHALLHVGALALVLVGIGIDRMVSHHDYPVLIRLRQGSVQPCQLLAVVGLGSVGILVGLLARWHTRGSSGRDGSR